MRKPFIVEFTGTPEAGKTTTINAISNKIVDMGLNVSISRESAEILPEQIPKGTPSANLWMHYRTQCRLLGELFNESDILLVDRGLVDSNFYGKKFLWQGEYSQKDYDEFRKQFNDNLFPDFIIAMMVPPEVSIKRRGKEGRLVNTKYLTTYNEQFLRYYEEITFPKVLMDTSNLTVDEMTGKILSIIMDNYKK